MDIGAGEGGEGGHPAELRSEMGDGLLSKGARSAVRHKA